MKRTKTIFLMVILFLASFDFSYSQGMESEKDKIINAAEYYLIHILEIAPESNWQDYGIRDRGQRMKMGIPLPIYTIEKDSVVFTNTWKVPLIVDEEYQTLCTVVKESEGKFRGVQLGARVLSKEIYEKNTDCNFQGLLRVYETKKDYLICDNVNGENKFRPIPNSNNQFFSYDELLKTIKK